MLGQFFITLCQIPGLKGRLWRAWYDYLARLRSPLEWTFMNYGYAWPGTQPLALAEADEPNRNWIQLYEHLASAIEVRGCTLLEVGSGRGGGASFLKRYTGAARVIGIDFSKTAIELSRAQHQVDGLEFRVGDAEHLPFSDGSFDAVINVESSHCYPSFEGFLSEVRRVLRPGGYFLHADFRGQAEVEAWRRQLRTSNLAILREIDITSNVIDALERDNDRKLLLIDQIVPKVLRASFLDFAAVRGSAIFDAFQSRKLIYMSFILQKPLNQHSA